MKIPQIAVNPTPAQQRRIVQIQKRNLSAVRVAPTPVLLSLRSGKDDPDPLEIEIPADLWARVKSAAKKAGIPATSFAEHALENWPKKLGLATDSNEG